MERRKSVQKGDIFDNAFQVICMYAIVGMIFAALLWGFIK